GHWAGCLIKYTQVWTSSARVCSPSATPCCRAPASSPLANQVPLSQGPVRDEERSANSARGTRHSAPPGEVSRGCQGPPARPEGGVLGVGAVQKGPLVAQVSNRPGRVPPPGGRLPSPGEPLGQPPDVVRPQPVHQRLDRPDVGQADPALRPGDFGRRRTAVFAASRPPAGRLLQQDTLAVGDVVGGHGDPELGPDVVPQGQPAGPGPQVGQGLPHGLRLAEGAIRPLAFGRSRCFLGPPPWHGSFPQSECLTFTPWALLLRPILQPPRTGATWGVSAPHGPQGQEARTTGPGAQGVVRPASSVRVHRGGG